jgi:glycosyltransferase involved in cell wall biosynthesis
MTPVSVVIPCYNGARYLPATLDAVMSQRGVDLDVIVVDDGSTDESARIVEARYPGVRLARQANGGVARARHRGVELARHDWVAFVDADDIWLPSKLSAQLQLHESNPACRLSYTAWHVWHCEDPTPDCRLVDELTASFGDERRWGGPSGWIYPDLLLDCHVWTSTVLLQRTLFEELGGFDPDLRVGEDWDLWLRASRVTPIIRLNAPYSLYRMHGESLTKRPPERNYKHLVVNRAIARWGYAGADGRAAARMDVRRSQARTWAELAAARLAAGNRPAAQRDAWKAVSTDPTFGKGWKAMLKSLCWPVHG